MLTFGEILLEKQIPYIMPEERGIGHPPHSDNTPLSKGKNWLLVIGIDEYTHHRKLGNAVADAKGFAEVMTTRFGFEFLHKPLYNAEATRTEIVEALSKCEDLAEHDRLIVFYAGHGWYKMKTKHGYLVPSEAEGIPNRDFISVNAILDIFKGVDAKHVLLIVDCCFGGSFGVDRNELNIQMTQKVVADLDTKRSRMVLSSGGIEPVSDGFVSVNHSPFTAPLLDILKSNDQSFIVLSDVFPLLRKKTKWNTNQMPQYKVLQHLGHEDGELAFYCTDLESPEERAYRELMEKQSIALMEKFIREFRESSRKAEVRVLLKDKRIELAWKKIMNSRYIEDFDEFLELYPESSYAELAQQKIDELEIADATEENARKEKERLEIERKKRTEAERKQREETEKQKKIAEKNARKEKDRLAAIERKKREEEERLRLLYEPEMVSVKGGTFNRDKQKVTLSDFSIGKYPITQKQWQNIMGDNPSRFKGETLPVEQVSWDDCQAFIKKLNEKTGKKYRLPTEAEWEFAARGGTKSKGFKYAGSNDLKEVAWFSENSENKTHPVGLNEANELGIHDLSGNVWEWCEDWYGAYTEGSVTNPKGAETGSERVYRGGSWAYSAEHCRVAFRNSYTPAYRNGNLGFRLVSSLQ